MLHRLVIVRVSYRTDLLKIIPDTALKLPFVLLPFFNPVCTVCLGIVGRDEIPTFVGIVLLHSGYADTSVKVFECGMLPRNFFGNRADIQSHLRRCNFAVPDYIKFFPVVELCGNLYVQFPGFLSGKYLRVLDRLMEEDLVHKVVNVDGGVGYASCHNCEVVHNHNHLHFSCQKCKSVTCIEDVQPLFKLPKGYKISEVNFTVSGLCPQCS